MFRPMSDLGTYLKENRIRQADFAAAIGVTQATVSKLIAGGRPSLPLAVAIERTTGGVVRAASWIPADEVAGQADLPDADPSEDAA